MPRQVVRDFGTCIDTGDFAGSVATAGSVSLSGSAVTLTAWVKFKAFQTGSPFISSIAGEENVADTHLALLRVGDGSGIGTNKRVSFALKFGGINNLNSVTDLRTGVWYHLAAVYDGAKMYIYINGSEDNSTTQTGSFTANDTFRVGSSSGGARFPSAWIDDVRCYKRALTPTEVSALSYGIEPASTDLTVWYKFDEGSGTSATDSSGNSNTGTLTSCTYSTDVFTVPRTAAGRRQVVRNFGTCLKFVPDSDKVATTSTIALTGAFTLYVWFKRITIDAATGNWILGSTGGTAKIGFFNNNSLNMFVRLVNAGSSATADIGYTTPLNEKWNFLAVVRDGANAISASLNGAAFVSIGTLSGTTTLNKIATDQAEGGGFNGCLDDIVIAPSAATIGEVQAAFYNGTYPSTKTLWYKFDEGSGTSTTDSSGNANTGTITGATYSTDVVTVARTAA